MARPALRAGADVDAPVPAPSSGKRAPPAEARSRSGRWSFADGAGDEVADAAPHPHDEEQHTGHFGRDAGDVGVLGRQERRVIVT
jgi:hypothetical protein